MCAQSYLTLCEPLDYSPSDSSVHMIFQGRILEWTALALPADIPYPAIESTSSLLLNWQAGSLTLQHLGNPNTIHNNKPKMH